MKRELMIGDWVEFNSGPAKVTGITDEGVHFVDRFGGGIASGADPIPLTPEILEKNWAAKWSEHSKTIKSFTVPIDEHSNISFQVMRGSSEVFVQYFRCGADSCEFRKNIKYVHELQHAMRLCWIEKEITIE